MTQKNRLPKGGRINRQKELSFQYDGKKYTGYDGDTLASALLANDVHLVGRSFKYHRPRGIMTAGVEEPNALVQLETGEYGEPNSRATQLELYDNLIAKSQNCFPSVKYDIGAVNKLISKFIPAGFYYKTFMPNMKGWMFFEKFIRQVAGLGKSTELPDPDYYARKTVYCDVLIAGGGFAGLVSALNAGKTGARVILMDEQNEMGGWGLTSPDMQIDGKKASDWVSDMLSKITKLDNVQVIPRCTVIGYFDYNFLTAVERITDHLGAGNGGDKPRQRFWRIRAKQVILAQGALERPMLFAENDKPGVMMASSIRTYVNRFGVLPGDNIIITTNNDTAYFTALDAFNAGAKITIVDIRKDLKSDLLEQVKGKGITVHKNSAIVNVKGTHRVKAVEIMQLSDDGKSCIGEKKKINCNLVGMSAGWTPTAHLYSQARGKLKWDEQRTMFVPDYCQQSVQCIGGCNGTMDMSDTLNESAISGIKAGKLSGNKSVSATKHKAIAHTEQPQRNLWIIPGEKPITRDRKHFHEFQNDATVTDILLAGREGYLSIEHLKRYTTTGMATDQGKTSNINALAVMAEYRGLTIPEVGTTTFRPPYSTTTIGAIAGGAVGELFEQDRRTPIDAWHKSNDAVYEPVGDWSRARYYPKNGEDMYQAVQRETLATRTSVGVMDGSTLGKIDICGKDAGKFLDLVYTNVFSSLKTGFCRYGLMLNEHGMVWDDGVTARINENHYHMTTTTGGAGRVYEWLEELHQTEWPEMEVFITSITEQYAVATLNGPNSAKVLSKICKDIDLDNEVFPFMTFRNGTVAGIPASVYRISFTGELSYEINVPSRYGLQLWQEIIKAGKEYDICPYGTETMHVLRAEKGFIIVGQDTDGTVTPMDLGMNWIVSKKKQDFIGKRSFDRIDTSRQGRKQFVGLLTDNKNVVLPEGAHIIKGKSVEPPVKMLGHITSSYMSPNCGHSIALAMVEYGFNLKGEKVNVATMEGKIYSATIVDTVFFDKEGKRTNG